VENRCAALVRGSSAIFPRGYLWLIPVWYAGLAAAMEVRAKPPSWYGACALAALALAAITLIAVLSTLRSNAFLADDTGIWLGLRAGARRRFGRRRRDYRYLPWPEIQELRIASRRYGARLDVFLRAAKVSRRSIVGEVIAAGLTVLIPPAYLFRCPGLLRPRSDHRRYRIPLYDVTAGELRLALAPLAPPTMAIGVRLRWRDRALRRLRRSRLTTAA
jgi:hypothetical protein